MEGLYDTPNMVESLLPHPREGPDRSFVLGTKKEICIVDCKTYRRKKCFVKVEMVETYTHVLDTRQSTNRGQRNVFFDSESFPFSQ